MRLANCAHGLEKDIQERGWTVLLRSWRCAVDTQVGTYEVGRKERGRIATQNSPGGEGHEDGTWTFVRTTFVNGAQMDSRYKGKSRMGSTTRISRWRRNDSGGLFADKCVQECQPCTARTFGRIPNWMKNRACKPWIAHREEDLQNHLNTTYRNIERWRLRCFSSNRYPQRRLYNLCVHHIKSIVFADLPF